MRNRNGFSLIELMVVTTIIAILSLVAIPSYKGFKARARQKEGFNLLTAYFTAAQSTRAEFGIFPGDFVQTGFHPVGVINYRLRAEDGNEIASMRKNDDACFRTQNDCDCGGDPACSTFKTWNEAPVGLIGQRLGPVGVEPNNCNGVGPTMVQDDRFTAKVAAVISTSATERDRYAIQETKVITMCNDGLK